MAILVPRFPILSEWFYQIAIRLEYSEIESLSLALARARIASSIPNVNRNIEYSYDGQIVMPKKPQKSTIKVQEIYFVSAYMPITVRPDGQLRGVYFRDNMPQLCTPDTFDQVVIERLSLAHYKEIRRALLKLSEHFSAEDLARCGTLLWELFAPMKSNGDKPGRGEKGQLNLDLIQNLTRTFKVPIFKPIMEVRV